MFLYGGQMHLQRTSSKFCNCQDKCVKVGPNLANGWLIVTAQLSICQKLFSFPNKKTQYMFIKFQSFQSEMHKTLYWHFVKQLPFKIHQIIYRDFKKTLL